MLSRKLTLDDFEVLMRMRANEDVSRYLGTAEMQTPEFVEKRLRFYISCYEKCGFGVSAIIRKADGEFIGWGGLQPLEDSGEIEVGYSFDKPFWGQGYATEVAAGWLRYGFEQLGLERIVAVAQPENIASTNVMEKLGMKYEKTAQHYGTECVFYAISRGEFMKVNSNKVKETS
ncbi:MAG: GNAT family N-acetyltransferase [Pyrinomonadaceae bacterium]